jgi:hypothetical protein
MVMTVVPGQSISLCASRTHVVGSGVLIDAARTFAMTMERYWSTGQRHGDLNLGNVLFDIEEKTISFIDAGTGADCRVCSDRIKYPSGAVTDIAHLLFEIASDMKNLVRGQAASMYNEMFVQHVLRAMISHMRSQEDRRLFRDHVWACVQDHITDKLDLSWSHDGVRNRLVKRVALRRIRYILDVVVSDLCYSTAK